MTKMGQSRQRGRAGSSSLGLGGQGEALEASGCLWRLRPRCPAVAQGPETPLWGLGSSRRRSGQVSRAAPATAGRDGCVRARGGGEEGRAAERGHAPPAGRGCVAAAAAPAVPRGLLVRDVVRPLRQETGGPSVRYSP